MTLQVVINICAAFHAHTFRGFFAWSRPFFVSTL
jgi:hypothetical protein